MRNKRLKIWNTLSGSREEFIPGDPQYVRIYVCGPTVYDRAHIGNARPAVVFDLLFRMLRRIYGQHHVRYVRNITDIDDKINARAARIRDEGDHRTLLEIIRSLTGVTTDWYHEDLAALNVLEPSEEPRATDFIDQMIDMISSLIDMSHAYEVDGHVLFSVDSYDGYGQLARRNTDDMLAGARVEIAPYKRNPMDFVLWKPSDQELPGWPSPWGRGRPGWHIECSAMSLHFLGKEFDIHGGGIDLAFPHHENEAAQSMCANPGTDFARYWMHNGLITVDGRKMAKSLGNFITVRDLLASGTTGDEIRYVMLGTHYRQQLDWTVQRLAEARSALNRWQRLTAGVGAGDEMVDDEMIAALSEDLNTPAAMTRLHQLAREGKGRSLLASARFVGLLEHVDDDRDRQVADEVVDLIEDLLRRRAEARVSRNFDLADRIRDDLASAGVSVVDGKNDSEWNIVGTLDNQLLERLVKCEHDD